ncbi:MAG: DUF922 domain-containing protein [Gelidibacter sp.]
MFYKSLIAICVSFLMVTPINDEVISWRDTIKLSWSQFKGTPRTDLSAVAVTASGITFEFSVKETDTHVVGFDTKVFAHFYPNKSWYIKEEGDDHILAHEQLHFDITELYARKFRKQISYLKVNDNIKFQLRNLHEKINKELAATQNRYDKESDNSVNREFQVKWNIYVKQELAKLEAYKSKD